MEVKKLTYGILTTIIAVVLVSAVLIPAISSSSTTTVEKENEGYLFTATDQWGTYTYTLDVTNKDILVNGEVLNAQKLDDIYGAGVATPTFGFSFPTDQTTFLLQGQGKTSVTNANRVNVTPSSWTYVYNSNTFTGGTISANSPILAAVNGGNYAVYAADTVPSVSVNSGDTVYYYNQLGAKTGDSTVQYMYRVAVVDGVATVDYANKISSGTLTDFSSSVSATCTYTDMVTENGVTTYAGLNVELTGISIGSFNAAYFAVPLVYTATETPDGPVHTLINIIPLLVLVGVMLGAVGLFISRRD